MSTLYLFIFIYMSFFNCLWTTYFPKTSVACLQRERRTRIPPFLPANVTSTGKDKAQPSAELARPPAHACTVYSRVRVALSARCVFIGHSDRATCSCLLVFKFQAGADSRVQCESFATVRGWRRESRTPRHWDFRTLRTLNTNVGKR